MTTYRIEAGTGQHIGDRHEQQDRIALFNAPRAPGYMMAVLADGMGGARGGSIAAEQAIRTAQQVFENFSPLTDDVEAMLHEIVQEIHTVIQLMTLASEMRPHCTLAMLVLTPENTAIWCHVGDVRLYRFSGPNLVERTRDHTEAGGVAHAAGAGGAAGVGGADNIASRMRPARLVSMLGNPLAPPLVTCATHAGLKAGDAFMLCSDGLWHYCGDGECGAAIAMNSPRDAAQMLIAKARERATDGDADNCTLGIVKLVVPPKPVPQYQIGKMRRAV